MSKFDLDSGAFTEKSPGGTDEKAGGESKDELSKDSRGQEEF